MATISPRRLFAVMAVLVIGVAVMLSYWRRDGTFASVALSGAVEGVLIGLIAGPFAGVVHLLSGSDRQAALRAVTLWGVVAVGVLLLLAGAGDALLSRFAGGVPAQ